MNAVVNKTNKSDQALIQEIRNGNKEAFEQLFFCYYYDLCALAAKITNSSDQARDVVQEVFFSLWKTRKDWQIHSSLKTYLYQAIWNKSLNAKKARKNRRELNRKFARDATILKESIKADSKKNTQKLVEKIWEIVAEMPERRRFVFTLHRKHGLSYKEIGKVMDISRKTVENHMRLAFKEIRDSVDPELFR